MNNNPGATAEGPLFKQVLSFFGPKNSAEGIFGKTKAVRNSYKADNGRAPALKRKENKNNDNEET